MNAQPFVIHHVGQEPVNEPLDSSDFSGVTWARLERHLNARLQKLREENDSSETDERTTAKRRGRIAEIKELLALPHGRTRHARPASRDADTNPNL